MKRCPACRRVYDRDSKFCQIDGTVLADFNSDPLIGHTIAKRYRLVRKLGHGSLGAVYLAAELATGRSVAVKILVNEVQCDDDVLRQCMWDARFATASQASNIVRVYEVDRTEEGRVFIAMEYLEGETLSDLIQREGALELGRALRLASQIAQGVAAASRAGVAHREITPQNVMVTGPDERVKVTDFGVAWLRRAVKGGSLMRLSDGAPRYIAPEQWLGADADDRTDVYGIGAVLHAMLAGAAPSIARTRAVTGSDTRWEAPPPIRTVRPEIPVSLEQFLARAMEREPERRHNGIEAFAKDLFNLTASIIETQTKDAASLVTAERASEEAPWRPYLEREQAYREQWRARWRLYRATWRTEGDRWQAWLHASRAQVSGGTSAVARAATGASRAIASKAGTIAGAAAGASRMVPVAARTAGHGLATVSHAAAGAATGTSRVVATAAGTVASTVGAAARTVPLAARAVGHGLAGVSRAGTGAATRASRAVLLAAGTTAGAAAAAARAVPVVSRAGARRVAPGSRVAASTIDMVADAVAGAARAAGHSLAGVSRAGAGAAMRASRAVAVATGTVAGAVAAGAAIHASRAVVVAAGTIAGAAAALAGAVPVVSRAAAHRVARASRAGAGAVGVVAHAVAGASRAVRVTAKASGQGLGDGSRVVADAVTGVSRTVADGTRTVAGVVAAGVVGASRTMTVTAQTVGRGVARASRAIAGTTAGVTRAVAEAAGTAAGAMAAAASRAVPVATRAARHGVTGLSRARVGAVTGISRTVVGASGAVALRSHGAARQGMVLVSRRRDEGLRWIRANGRRLSTTSAAALVMLGMMTWVTVGWYRGDRAEAPSPLRSTAARDAGSAVERGTFETASSIFDSASPRRDGSKISRADDLARQPAAPAAPTADGRTHTQPLEAARGQQDRAESAGGSLAVGSRIAQLSSQQVSRIQAQAEQKLRHRGLLRVSAADRWGVTLETASTGEVTLAGVLRDMALYDEAVRLVREVPEVKAVRGSVEVSDVGAVPIVHSDSARIQAEIQQKLRSRGLLRESDADRWGVTVEVNPEGDVTLVGAVRDTEMYSEAVRRAREVARVRQVKQDIRVMERDLQQ